MPDTPLDALEAEKGAERHGPLLRRPVGSALGWLVAECDCGWRSDETCSQLQAIEFYGDHRAQAALTAAGLPELLAVVDAAREVDRGWGPGIQPHAEWVKANDRLNAALATLAAVTEGET